MIFSEMQLPANLAGAARLDRVADLEGPRAEGRRTPCRTSRRSPAAARSTRLSDTVFDREIELGGARYVERVWLGRANRVVFTRTEGRSWARSPTRSSRTDGELGLRFQFALVIAPRHQLPISEDELARQMVTAYRPP